MAAIAALLASPYAVAATRVERDATAAKKGLADAVAARRLAPESAARYRTAVDQAVSLWRRLPGTRATNLAGALHDAAVLAPRYDEARALTIFAGLEVNTEYFGTKAVPSGTIDVEDADGVVYRLFTPRGFQFHPLGNFSRLNAHAVRKDYEAASALAQALLDRSVATPTGLTWEYYFPFGGGRAPWTSGMAQAVAAQAFSRAATALQDPALLEPAAQAARAAEALSRTTSAGPWIRLYSFSTMLVLNAQLQAALSLAEYGRTSGDATATLFADRLEASAAGLISRFDTGAWSLYALNGAEATLHYHKYVISLLKRLGQLDTTTDWASVAERFDSYLYVPPELAPLGTGGIVYPQPRDGFRDQAIVTFSLSKISTVRLAVGGERKSYLLQRGRRTLSWDPGKRPPRRYAARLFATDLAGNTAELALEPIEVRRDTDVPLLSAELRGRTLVWEAEDEGTPWLRLRVLFQNGAARKQVDLGRRRLNGVARLKLPPGRWGARLLAGDSTGNTAAVSLGAVVG